MAWTPAMSILPTSARWVISSSRRITLICMADRLLCGPPGGGGLGQDLRIGVGNLSDTRAGRAARQRRNPEAPPAHQAHVIALRLTAQEALHLPDDSFAGLGHAAGAPRQLLAEA